jgi:hypothetical protein
LYHVINRGNCRSDVFARAGAANAFERTLADASERHGWRVLWDQNLASAEEREIKESRWGDEFERAMREAGKSESDIAADPPGSHWKIELAERLRRRVAAPYRWISEKLKMGSPLAVCVNVCRFANR